MSVQEGFFLDATRHVVLNERFAIEASGEEQKQSGENGTKEEQKSAQKLRPITEAADLRGMVLGGHPGETL